MQYSVFYQLPAARDQDARRRYAETIQQIQHADELGMRAAWLAEGHFDPTFSVMPSPLVMAAALAPITRSIRLGTAAVQLPVHHPVEVAELAGMVDVLSDGRFELGVGRGSSPAQLAGFGVPWHERDTRFLESLAVIRQAFAEPRVTYRGEHYPLEGVKIVPRPVQAGGPPIWVTANSTRSAHLAGELGLGLLMAAPIHPWRDHFIRHVTVYRNAARRVGAEARVGAVFFTFPGRDMAAVRAVVGPSLRNHPIGAAVPFEFAADAMALFGSPEQCAEKLAAIAGTGLVDELIGWFNPGGLVPHEDVLAAMTTLHERVLPAASPLPAIQPLSRAAGAYGSRA